MRCVFWQTGSVEPTHEPEDIRRQGRQEMLEMRLALPDVACSAHAGVACGLGEGAFNPASRLVYVQGCGLSRTYGDECLARWQNSSRLVPKASAIAELCHPDLMRLNVQQTGFTKSAEEPRDVWDLLIPIAILCG